MLRARNYCSSVGIVTGLRYESRRLTGGRGRDVRPYWIWGPNSLLHNWKGVGEANHSPTSNDEIKNCGAIPTLPPMSSGYSA
jgi:hypothetical protein